MAIDSIWNWNITELSNGGTRGFIFSLLSLFLPPCSKTLSSSSSSSFAPCPLFLKFHSSPFTQNLILSNPVTKNLSFIQRCTAVDDISADTKPSLLQKRKLYVVNLPWSLSVADIKDLFGQCGTVADVEVALVSISVI